MKYSKITLFMILIFSVIAASASEVFSRLDDNVTMIQQKKKSMFWQFVGSGVTVLLTSGATAVALIPPVPIRHDYALIGLPIVWVGGIFLTLGFCKQGFQTKKEIAEIEMVGSGAR